MVWLFGSCPSPPRAYPARGASLARAPFAVRKGRGWCWFSGSAGNRCVGGLVGKAGLKPAPTGWRAGCIDGQDWVLRWQRGVVVWLVNLRRKLALDDDEAVSRWYLEVNL